MKSIFPPVEALLELEPEEVGEYLFMYLKNIDKEKDKFGRLNVTLYTNTALIEYAKPHEKAVSFILNEAWEWLLNMGLIAPDPGEQGYNWFFITRRGQKIKDIGDLRQFVHLKLLPKQALDSKLAQKVWPPFIRGDFEMAVFAAYKQVEVRVRDAAELTTKDYGTDLARKAFNVKNGSLTDRSNPNKGEEQAYADVFAGVLGAFKNPSSHKDVDYDDPATVAGLILFANTLIQIVEQRRKTHKVVKAQNLGSQESAL